MAVAYGADALLEREDELARLRALLEEVGGRGGRLVVIEGPAGIGKTSLLSATRSMAIDLGFATLGARGSPIEREFGFGIARQLFERFLRSLPEQAQGEALAGAAVLAEPVVLGVTADPRTTIYPSLHGLYWLCVNLADQRPLLLTVDDAHWADDASVQWLRYLARRLEDVRALIAVTRRPAEPHAASPMLDGLAAEAAGHLMTVGPLSEQAARRLAARTLGRDAGRELVRECHARSGGNPFLLRELLAALAAEQIDPRTADAPQVRAVRPRPVTRTIEARLGGMPAACRSLVIAVAVLETNVQLHRAAALAELPLGEAVDALEALVAADILAADDALGFVHPLVRDAVYEQITAPHRAELHRVAAELLRHDGAPPERVGAHLLSARRAGDRGAVIGLREAARTALSRGATGPAVAYLQRALEEPPHSDERATVFFELGEAQARSSPTEAVAHLQEALSMVTDPVARATISRALAGALMNCARPVEAFDALEPALAALTSDADRELRLRIEGEMLAIGLLTPTLCSRVTERISSLPKLAGDTSAERLALANVARYRWLQGAAASEAGDLAMKAMADGALLADQIPDSPTFGMTISVLLHAGRPKDAVAMIELLQQDASRRGSVTGAAIATSLLASAQSRTGDLMALEALSRRTLELSLEGGWQTGVALAVSLLVTALTRQGDLNEAEETLLGRGLVKKLPETVSFFDWLLLARGELRIAQHRTQDGLDDMLEIGRHERLTGWEDGLLWRVRAAPVLAARGEHDHARRLAEKELEMARHRGTPGHLGTALQALGLTLQGTAGIEHLRDAAALLAKSGWRLEHARALGDLGAALRRANHRAEAREPLRAALEIAHRCGALPLEQTIRTELTATGARPRNVMLTGAESLTTSERRIADLAARGLTNPQIAQTLFVTRKTVELHLSNAYRKLGIQSRQQLPEALAKNQPTGRPSFGARQKSDGRDA